MKQQSLIVIGGGAAGFFCAVNAARLHPALAVTIVERSGKLLSKVKVSGGGRCNVTHACFDIQAMSKRYPRGEHFVKKTFHQFFVNDTLQWFRERGVDIRQEEDGRMFPVTNSSQTIIDCLLQEANRYGVNVRLHTEITQLVKEEHSFLLTGKTGEILTADYVCVACGGYPKTAMFEWLVAAGHTIEEPVPSLFTFNLPKHPITKLMGVSVKEAEVRLPFAKLAQQGPLLITHWGLSGPAVLKLSAWGARALQKINWEFTGVIKWLPGENEQSLKEKFIQYRVDIAAQKMDNRNPFGVPQRLWDFFLSEAGVLPETRWADLSSKMQNSLLRFLTGYEVKVKGKTTYKEEFVTAGGIRLSEIDHQTMMSKKVQKLFFAGEIMDVDGITGGFNFQHAWTSGYIAAQAISNLSQGT